jgi:hypothetical protein
MIIMMMTIIIIIIIVCNARVLMCQFSSTMVSCQTGTKYIPQNYINKHKTYIVKSNRKLVTADSAELNGAVDVRGEQHNNRKALPVA